MKQSVVFRATILESIMLRGKRKNANEVETNARRDGDVVPRHIRDRLRPSPRNVEANAKRERRTICRCHRMPRSEATAGNRPLIVRSRTLIRLELFKQLLSTGSHWRGNQVAVSTTLVTVTATPHVLFEEGAGIAKISQIPCYFQCDSTQASFTETAINSSPIEQKQQNSAGKVRFKLYF